MLRNSSAWDSEILQAFHTLIPYFPHLFEEDIIFSMTDRIRFIKFVPTAHLQPNIKEGDLIPPGDAIYEAMRLGQPIIKILPRELYGAEFKAIGIPVKDKHGQVIGGIGIGRRI